MSGQKNAFLSFPSPIVSCQTFIRPERAFFCPDTDFPPPLPPPYCMLYKGHNIFLTRLLAELLYGKERRGRAQHTKRTWENERAEASFFYWRPPPPPLLLPPSVALQKSAPVAAPNLIISRRKENRLWGKGGKERRCI